jgi:hypothetical protein
MSTLTKHGALPSDGASLSRVSAPLSPAIAKAVTAPFSTSFTA